MRLRRRLALRRWLEKRPFGDLHCDVDRDRQKLFAVPAPPQPALAMWLANPTLSPGLGTRTDRSPEILRRDDRVFIRRPVRRHERYRTCLDVRPEPVPPRSPGGGSAADEAPRDNAHEQESATSRGGHHPPQHVGSPPPGDAWEAFISREQSRTAVASVLVKG